MNIKDDYQSCPYHLYMVTIQDILESTVVLTTEGKILLRVIEAAFVEPAVSGNDSAKAFMSH